MKILTLLGLLISVCICILITMALTGGSDLWPEFLFFRNRLKICEMTVRDEFSGNISTKYKLKAMCLCGLWLTISEGDDLDQIKQEYRNRLKSKSEVIKEKVIMSENSKLTIEKVNVEQNKLENNNLNNK